MSQSSITSFFNSRKRAAPDEISCARHKVQIVEDDSQITPRGGTHKNVKLLSNKKEAVACAEAASTRGKRGRAVAKLSFDEVASDEIYNYSDAVNIHQQAVKKACDKTVNLKATEKKASVMAFLKKQSCNVPTSTKDVSQNCIVNESRKELSLGELKAKLAGSSRFAELKASAERFTRNYQLLKSQAALKEFKSIDVEVPTSPGKRKLNDGFLSPKKTVPDFKSDSEKPLISPRKVVVSPVKSPSKVPAYIRHASLVKTDTQLPLPHHYRSLAEIFRGLEQVASLLFNRKEKITFAKLRPSVQEMLKKNFTEKHLEQIKQLVPEFYNFEIEKIKSFSASTQKQAFDLLVIPLLPPGVSQMSPNELLKRRRVFFERLTDIVKKHHEEYLLKLDPPMMIPINKLVRWHPQFELEKIPDVEGSKLPEMPGKETYSTAKDVLSKAREIFSCNTRMERALENLAVAKARGLTEEEKAATGLTNQTTSALSTVNVTLINPALRNLPASLLEKIKAKQAAKALEAMTRSKEDEKKYLMYNRLPDLARTLRNIFVTERKNVLDLSLILSKLESSFQGRVSKSDLHGDIEVLTKEVPNWVCFQIVRNVKYLKLNRDTNLESIKQKLNDLADRYKN